MNDASNWSLGEAGFNAVRFGEPSQNPESCELTDVLPILMCIDYKSKIGLADISRAKLAQILNVCAGMTVKTRASTELSASIRVGLKERSIEISQDAAGGLRDAIFAAVLLRVYHDEAFAGLPFAELIDEARLTILDELPHAMGYSGSDELECTMLENHSIVLKTHYYPGSCALPLPVREKVVEHRAVTLHAA